MAGGDSGAISDEGGDVLAANKAVSATTLLFDNLTSTVIGDRHAHNGFQRKGNRGVGALSGEFVLLYYAEHCRFTLGEIVK